MELWIRSQDRQDLIIVSRNFHIQETSVNPHSHKWGILLDGGKYIGEYNSEERALEVLDEIQKFILRDLKIVNSSYENADIEIKAKSYIDNCKIYEMPKE